MKVYHKQVNQLEYLVLVLVIIVEVYQIHQENIKKYNMIMGGIKMDGQKVK